MREILHRLKVGKSHFAPCSLKPGKSRNGKSHSAAVAGLLRFKETSASAALLNFQDRAEGRHRHNFVLMVPPPFANAREASRVPPQRRRQRHLPRLQRVTGALLELFRNPFDTLRSTLQAPSVGLCARLRKPSRFPAGCDLHATGTRPGARSAAPDVERLLNGR